MMQLHLGWFFTLIQQLMQFIGKIKGSSQTLLSTSSFSNSYDTGQKSLNPAWLDTYTGLGKARQVCLNSTIHQQGNSKCFTSSVKVKKKHNKVIF